MYTTTRSRYKIVEGIGVMNSERGRQFDAGRDGVCIKR